MGDYGRKSSRGGGESRFYSPPAMRRQQKAHQQPQKVQQQHQKEIEPVATPELVVEPEPEPECLTNLDRFLENTRPRVPVQFLSKTTMRERRKSDVEPHPYFVLGDLWETFKEWSAYGAGVPLILSGNESVIQYYVPYLSAIQLYVDPSKPVTKQRRPDEESDLDSSRGNSSDGSDDNGADNVEETLRLQDHKSNRALAERMFLKSYTFAEFPGEEKEVKNPPDLLVYEYFAQDPPYGRQPLVDKISQLATQFPDLRTYKSCDLTTASWVSVAWYPIYRIPMGPTLQSLDACFLTYHSLSTPLTRAANVDSLHLHGPTSIGRTGGEIEMPPKLSLSTFALASYKFRISFWTHIGEQDESQKSDSLTQAAENWLRLLQVEHPDFNFFLSHSSYWL